MKKHKRLLGIDIFRGWAILLMIVFHISFDLQHFHIIDFHIQSNNFFRWFRFIIVSMFLFTVGMSLKLAHKNQINWSKLKKRAIYLGFSSFLVTTASYFIFPNSWIYFGILHFILLSSFVVLPLLNYPYTALIIAVSTFIAFHLDILNMHWLFNLVVTPLHLPPTVSVDVLRFFPWISFILIGMAIVTLNLHLKLFNNNFFNRKSKINNFFTIMGKHALLIYLIHQPLLFGIFLVMKS
jgi:uncharacterized membrane protein